MINLMKIFGVAIVLVGLKGIYEIWKLPISVALKVAGTIALLCGITICTLSLKLAKERI